MICCWMWQCRGRGEHCLTEYGCPPAMGVPPPPPFSVPVLSRCSLGGKRKCWEWEQTHCLFFPFGKILRFFFVKQQFLLYLPNSSISFSMSLSFFFILFFYWSTIISSLGNTQESFCFPVSLPVGLSLNPSSPQQPRDLSQFQTQTNLPFLFLEPFSGFPLSMVESKPQHGHRPFCGLPLPASQVHPLPWLISLLLSSHTERSKVLGIVVVCSQSLLVN